SPTSPRRGGDRTDRFVLLLTPTRELGLQVAEAFTSYATNLDDFSVLPIYGGQSYGPQLAGLKRGAQVVVGTPGRVIDHLKRGSLKLENLQHLVLDEADEMLKMGFAEDIEEIFNATGDSRQVALFSATMPTSIHRLTGKYLNDPEEVRVAAKSQTGSNIRQRYLMVQHSHKLDALTRILEVEEYDGIIMFVRTKQATEELAEKLRARGFKASAINGDIPQQARERTVEMLREGKIDILVATDVAARGLDVDDVTHVVNFQSPEDEKTYVHRIGRTGRAGNSGVAVTLVDWDDMPRWRLINKALGLDHDEPAETYSTSPHFFTDLGIPKGTKGRLPHKHGESTDNTGEEKRSRGRGSSGGRRGGGSGSSD
ncbi:ATP-dependent helicase, partial [Burkholderia multivorans]